MNRIKQSKINLFIIFFTIFFININIDKSLGEQNEKCKKIIDSNLSICEKCKVLEIICTHEKNTEEICKKCKNCSLIIKDKSIRRLIDSAIDAKNNCEIDLLNKNYKQAILSASECKEEIESEINFNNNPCSHWFHRIEQGDTISQIVCKYHKDSCGDSGVWKKIIEKNNNINPHKLEIGNQIMIFSPFDIFSSNKKLLKSEDKEQNKNQIKYSLKPKNGEKLVPPDLSELFIYFEQSMDKDWNIQECGGDIPKFSGVPEFLNNNETFRIKVKLEPDTEYKILLKQFKDKKGNLLSPFEWTFKTRKQGIKNLQLDDAKNKCKEAAKIIKDKKLKYAIEAIKGPNFASRESYVFIITLKGVVIAHPEPGLVNKDILPVKDINGKEFIKDMIHLAKTKGEGVVSYLWPKPGASKPSKKRTYIYRVEGEDYATCCGFYEK